MSEQPGANINTLLDGYVVSCAITGDDIPLSELKYWNVERQIAYKNPYVIPRDHFYPDVVV